MNMEEVNKSILGGSLTLDPPAGSEPRILIWGRRSPSSRCCATQCSAFVSQSKAKQKQSKSNSKSKGKGKLKGNYDDEEKDDDCVYRYYECCYPRGSNS